MMETIQTSLFDEDNEREKPGEVFQPLADRMRPETLEEYVGQKQQIGRAHV